MKKIGKKELVLLVLAIIVFLSALGYFCYKEIPELIKPKVYYRTYTKEKGWSRWSKNGETSGNKYNIKAIQITLKTSKKGNIYYKTLYKFRWEEKNRDSKVISGNKKDDLNGIKIGLTKDLYKKYDIEYHINNKKGWTKWTKNGIESISAISGIHDAPFSKIEIRIVRKSGD